MPSPFPGMDPYLEQPGGWPSARYADEIDYTLPVPAPSLRPADAAWVTERVQRWLAARLEP